jgi:hypothetical protein
MAVWDGSAAPRLAPAEEPAQRVCPRRLGLGLGFGRIVVSEIEAPIMLVNLV